jgi:hypothetical protein
MTWDDVFWHVMNFVLPAWVLSLGITAWGSVQFKRQAQIAGFGVGCSMLWQAWSC